MRDIGFIDNTWDVDGECQQMKKFTNNGAWRVGVWMSALQHNKDNSNGNNTQPVPDQWQLKEKNTSSVIKLYYIYKARFYERFVTCN